MFDNVFRRLLYNPTKLYSSYIGPGDTAMDVGCGMGYNAIGMAKIVGDQGRVIAVDLQPEMLEVLARRAAKAGVAHRIRTYNCRADSIGVSDTVDFAVAFWVFHEVPDVASLMREVHACLRPGGKFLVAEPRFHVSRDDLGKTVEIAEDAGLKVIDIDRPKVRGSLTVLLGRD